MEFHQYVANMLRNLRLSYDNVVSSMEVASNTIIADIDYSLVLNSLDRAISTFKKEIAEASKDYNRLKDADRINEKYIKQYLKGEIEKLKKSHKEVTETVPDDIIKKYLNSKNYTFHTLIPKLSEDVFFNYFEANYLISE